MSSTRIFIRPDNDDEYYYFMMIEDDHYFRPLSTFKHERVGNFRVHGKYVSTFHPGRIPNEYYCNIDGAMTLRSGRKLNYSAKTSCFAHLSECSTSFNGTPKWRCLSLKKVIWGYENYYHILSTCYQFTQLYDMSRSKIKEFIAQLEKSVGAVYKERDFEVVNEDGEDIYKIDHTEPMPERDTEGKYTFCNCRYTVVEGDRAIDKWGHHLDELLPRLKKLDKMYSKPHRVIKDSDAFKFVNKRINDDCRNVVFSFIKAQDIKGMIPAMPAPIPRR